MIDNIAIQMRKKLKQIPKTNLDPSVRVEAGMTLNIWKKQGYLTR